MCPITYNRWVIRLTPEQFVFVTERHFATFATLRADGSPHVVPVAFTWDAARGVARVTTSAGAVKARNAARPGPDGGAPRAAICQFDGARWITLEGRISVSADPAEVANAEVRYARRYTPLEASPDRVVLRLDVDRVMSSPPTAAY